MLGVYGLSVWYVYVVCDVCVLDMYVCVCVYVSKKIFDQEGLCNKELLQVIWHAITLRIFCGSLESKRPHRSEINKVADSSGLKCCHHLAGVCCHTLISDGEV